MIRRALLLLALLPRQDDTDILGVPELHGFVRLTITSKGSVTKTEADGGFATTTWDSKDEVSLEGRFDKRLNAASVFVAGRPPDLAPEKGRYQSWHSDAGRKNPHLLQVRGESTSKELVEDYGEAKSLIRDTTTVERSSSGGADTRVPFSFQVDRKSKTYAFPIPLTGFAQVRIKVRRHTVHRHEQIVTKIDETDVQDDAGPAHMVELDRSVVASLSVIEEPFPSGAVAAFQGSRTIPLKLASQPAGQGKVETQAVVQWSFSPKPPDRYELEVEAKGTDGTAYDKWRPSPGPDESTPGSAVTVTARLKGPRGGNSDYPLRIRLRLIDVSREKGVSLNWPKTPLSVPAPDLKFVSSKTPKTTVLEKVVWTTDENAEELSADLGCFDAGAWGEIAAECDLASGRFVRATILDRPGETTLLVPRRAPGRLIAECWDPRGPDDADVDAQPPGDVTVKGDGLTNYEEYRGFHVQGKWTEGDPDKKEFFVRDETGGMAEPGIALFESLSKLRVLRLDADEFPAGRVINAHRTTGPHKVDQHGIRIVHDITLGGFCQAEGNGRPGLPKDNKRVALGMVPTNVVQAPVSGGAALSISYLAPTVAHELFHCCNVWHHGDPPGDPESYVWKKQPAGITENGAKITPVNEAGDDVSSLLSFPEDNGTTRKIDIGKMNGKSSGDVGCVMRYDAARGRVDPARPTLRILFDYNNTGEVVGAGLCTSGLGTGANAPGPNTRFGDCQKGRGNCAGQIMVNDAATAKPR